MMNIKPVFAILLYITIVGSSFSAIQLHKAQNTIELLQVIETILFHGQSDPSDLMQITHEIHLEPGFYKIPAQESILLDYYKFYTLRARSAELNQQVRLIVDYPWPYDKEVIYSEKLASLLKTLHRDLQEGLKFSREILYTVQSPTQLPYALKRSVSNRQDTTIRLPYCEKPACLYRPDIIETIKNIRMMADDGMRLRLKSRFFSWDLNKFLFFERELQPFVVKLTQEEDQS